jgi:signal transduction histidine kinase
LSKKIGLIWLALTLAGAFALARAELSSLREGFDVNARIMHRLLSQRLSQHDAVLATLALLQAQNKDEERERRLTSVYPQMMSIHKLSADSVWPDAKAVPDLKRAQGASSTTARPALAAETFSEGRYWLVLASMHYSYALLIDQQMMVPWTDWPFENQGKNSAVRVTLESSGQVWTLQKGAIDDTPWQFVFRKSLASDSQPFVLLASRSVGWAELPWLKMLLWMMISAVIVVAARAFEHQRRERERAQEWLRLGKVSRLNTLGELAAGMAHELNQPLTAVLANTQAAARLLKEAPPEISTAQLAMQRASEQARRASDLLTRLRRTVDRTDGNAQSVTVNLNEAVRSTLYLLEPQCKAMKVNTEIEATMIVHVLADPVALEQVIHNIATNALQALEGSSSSDKHLRFAITKEGTVAQLRIRDNGPGMPAAALPHLFEPFFTLRPDGLGLGLSVCESLLQGMNGSIKAQNVAPQGAEFLITLVLASANA